MKNNFGDWVETQKNIEKIGKLVVFFIPSCKITDLVRKDIHDFFVTKHNAYTHENGEIFGYWLDNSCLVKDKHEIFEIAVKDENKLFSLVDFLTKLCRKIEEKSIYLKIENESYLVYPKEN